MKRSYKDYLQDIAESIDKIEEFTSSFLSDEDFKHDSKTVFAVIRALEIMGEAVKKIPAAVKSKYHQVPWKEIAGMRDKLIHEYFGVNATVVWNTVKEDIPIIKPLINKIIQDL